MILPLHARLEKIHQRIIAIEARQYEYELDVLISDNDEARQHIRTLEEAKVRLQGQLLAEIQGEFNDDRTADIRSLRVHQESL